MPVVADSHQCDEEQDLDQDPHHSEKSDPDPHQSKTLGIVLNTVQCDVHTS
jgi:hypothetical protein